jgi:hypothetical protein
MKMHQYLKVQRKFVILLHSVIQFAAKSCFNNFVEYHVCLTNHNTPKNFTLVLGLYTL